MFDDVYISNLLNEGFWIRKGDDLMEAARVFEKIITRTYEQESTQDCISHHDNKFQDAYYMLVSYAIENYLKAIILANNKDSLKQKIYKTKKLPEELKSHALLKLLEKAGLSMLATQKSLEQKVLEKLTECAMWKGRYHAPIDARSFNKSIGNLDSDSDICVINQLVKKLKF